MLLKAQIKLSTHHHGQLVLTGLTKVQLPPLRIKVNAVHAGLSHPLVLLKVPTKLQLVNSSPSLNNNLLIAFKPASVAMEVGKHVLSLTTKATTHILRTHTLPTLLLMELAPTMLPKHLKLTLQLSPRQQQTQLPPFNKLLHNNPSQFQLKPTLLISKLTHLVSSPAPHAVQQSTTQFSLLVMVPQTEPTTGS